MTKMTEDLKREDRGAGEVPALGASEVGIEEAGGTEAGGEGGVEEAEGDQVITALAKMKMEIFKWKEKDGKIFLR